MSSRHRFVKRSINPDRCYGNVMVSCFINMMMYDGKKTVAEGLFYKAMDLVKKKTEKQEDELGVFLKAVANVTPPVEVRSKRVGGTTYQVPVEIRANRARYLSLKMIIVSARKARATSGDSFDKVLAEEIWLASNKSGNAYRMCEDKIKMAEANRAFSHIRV